ncbi:MAG: hypothetical protein R2822_22660 [Spirosomataceae bacterium]
MKKTVLSTPLTLPLMMREGWTQTARMYPLDPIADIQWNDLLKLMDNQETQKNHPNFKRI